MIKHQIVGDEYQVVQDGRVVFTIDLDYDLDQVHIRTDMEDYAGPVKLIWFSEEPKKYRKDNK